VGSIVSPPQDEADLKVDFSLSQNEAEPGDRLDFNVVLTNLGPWSP
jgi:hypothetical protein